MWVCWKIPHLWFKSWGAHYTWVFTVIHWCIGKWTSIPRLPKPYIFSRESTCTCSAHVFRLNFAKSSMRCNEIVWPAVAFWSGRETWPCLVWLSYSIHAHSSRTLFVLGGVSEIVWILLWKQLQNLLDTGCHLETTTNRKLIPFSLRDFVTFLRIAPPPPEKQCCKCSCDWHEGSFIWFDQF